MENQKKFYVGLLHFNEPYGLDLTERLNGLDALKNECGEMVKICAEHILIHEVSMDYRPKYDLIIDRGSHILKHAVGIFMTFAFRGVYLINNPLSFHYFISNKDVGFSIAHDLGIRVPKTYALPSHTTPFLKQDDFAYHRLFDWEKMMQDVGWPCYIKPAGGRGAFAVQKVHNMEELWHHYNLSGSKIMTVQSYVESSPPWHVRCLCIGRKIIPMKYIFGRGDQSRYIYEENFLTQEQGQEIIDSTKIINRAFGYEMNSVEFILDTQGNPWAIDFNNPVPDARKNLLGDIFYDDYVHAMVQRVCEVAREGASRFFVPDINRYSSLSRLQVSRKEKFKIALKIADEYYEAIQNG